MAPGVTMRFDSALLVVSLVVSLGAVAGATGCGEQVRWGGETTAQETQTNAPVEAAPKKMTAQEFAASFATSRKCADEAAKQYDADAKKGLILLTACVDRGDYFDLQGLLTGPWREALMQDEQGPVLVTRVIAARGGLIEVDAATCQEHRFPVLTLEEAFEDPGAAAGRLVLTRAVAKKKPKRNKKGQLVVDAAEVAPDPEAPTAGLQPSGRVLQLVFKDLESAPKPGKETIVLARFEAVLDEPDAPPLQPLDGEETVVEDRGIAPAAQSQKARAMLLSAVVSSVKK